MEAAGMLGGAFKGGASVLSGFGQAQADDQQAAMLDREAQMARTTGLQTAGAMTRNLTAALGNIDAVRAAAKTMPNSPTGSAVRQEAEDVGLQQRQNKMMQYYNQASIDESEASYLRHAANMSILGGVVGGLGAFF